MQRQQITIDGSRGEGGGQIVRSSLALAMLTSTPIRIENIRSKRKKPGLGNQHLTAVNAAIQISGSTCDGASVGSQQLEFYPGAVKAGHFEFRIHTAGSATLVLQTVLPALMVADGDSSLSVIGGTHNPLAPTADFLSRAYLPLVNRMGPRVELELDRYGFYPAGGGRIRCRVFPHSFRGLHIPTRGKTIKRSACAMVANLPRHIAERECATLERKSKWPSACFTAKEVESNGPGNVVTMAIDSEHISEVFTGFGQRGVAAESVATNVWRSVKRYQELGVPVGEYLADQIILPMALAAHVDGQQSSFNTMELSKHATTHIGLLRQFLKVRIDVSTVSKDDVTVSVAPRS